MYNVAITCMVRVLAAELQQKITKTIAVTQRA